MAGETTPVRSYCSASGVVLSGWKPSQNKLQFLAPRFLEVGTRQIFDVCLQIWLLTSQHIAKFAWVLLCRLVLRKLAVNQNTAFTEREPPNWRHHTEKWSRLAYRWCVAVHCSASTDDLFECWLRCYSAHSDSALRSVLFSIVIQNISAMLS